MSLFIQQSLAIAATEWRLVRRSLGLFLVLLLIALAALPAILTAHQVVSWADDGGVSYLIGSAPLMAALAAFLIVPTGHREATVRVAELIWVRPLGAAASLCGKLLAAAAIMAVLLAELMVLVAVWRSTGGGSIGLALPAAAVLAVAPILLLLATIYVACGALVRNPLPGYLLALVLAVAGGLAGTQSMVFLWNPWARSLSFTPTQGFGSDLALLIANHLFYGGIAISLIGAVILLFARRERRALAPGRQRAAACAVLVAGMVLAGIAVPRFDSAVAAVTLSGNATIPAAVTIAVGEYRLDLRIDPSSGRVAGTVHFTARNHGTAAVPALPLYLNDGLRITAATVAGRPAAIHGAALFGTVSFAPPLAPGARTTVQISYAGTYKLLRDQYARPSTGLIAGADRLPDIQAQHQCMIGGGLVVLYRDGDWYPLPWTSGVMLRRPPPVGWSRLTVRVPAGLTALASTTDARGQGDEQLFSWQLHARLPMAVLAVVPARYARVAVLGGSVYAPPFEAAWLRTRYGPYVQALHDLDSYFGQPVRSVAVVAVYSGDGGGIHAAVGGGLALVDLGGIDRSPYGVELAVSGLAPDARYRTALADLASGWWAARLPSFAHPSVRDPSVDFPSRYVVVAEETVESDWWLADYTAAAVAGRRLGPAFYAREMRLRRTAVGWQSHEKGFILGTDFQSDQGHLGPEVRAVGLVARLQLGPDGTLSLDRLQRAIGPEKLRAALIGLSAAAGTLNDPVSVGCALTHATGRPLTSWLRHDDPSYVTKGSCR